MKVELVLRILAARWRLILLSTLSCVLGASAILVNSAPRYDATARITLDYIRPDRDAGVVLNSKMVEAYVKSQLDMLRNDQVTGRAVEALGWVDNPDIQLEYASTPESANLDIRSWLGQRLAVSVSGRQIDETNIIEIHYRAGDPESALMVVQDLRDAMIASSMELRRETSLRAAEGLDARAAALGAEVVQKERAQADLERATGVILANEAVDVDSARLGGLVVALPNTQTLVAPILTGKSGAAQRLEFVDAQLAAAEALGPNHPKLIELRQQQAALRAQVAGKQSAASAMAAAVAASATRRAGVLEEQKSKVLSQREQVLQVRTAKDEADGRRAVLNSTLRNISDLRQSAATAGSAISALGPAVSDKKPAFPNPTLMLGGASFLGVVLGSLLALLGELSGRVVRSVNSLEAAIDVTVIGVLPVVSSRLWSWDYVAPQSKRGAAEAWRANAEAA